MAAALAAGGDAEHVMVFLGFDDSRPSQLRLVLPLAPWGSATAALRSGHAPLPIDSLLLLYLCRSAARGLAYMHSVGIIHRDLAARNILLLPGSAADAARVPPSIRHLAARLTPVLSDFGMSRPISRRGTAGPGPKIRSRPVRWMAPEALVDHRYTRESDVYSLGITLWEIGSRGDLPYGRAMAHDIVVRRVSTEGLRPGRPLRFPTGLFSIAKLCWAQEPSRRITAARAADLIDARLANRTRR